MKRIFLLALVLALLFSASSCLRVEKVEEDLLPLPDEPEDEQVQEPSDEPKDEEEPPAEPEEPQEPEVPDAPVLPELPEWTYAESTALTFLQTNGVVDCSKREYSYSEMEEDLQIFAKAYPEIFSYRSFGKSVLGRELYVAVLGNPNAQKQILVSAGIHGREYLTPLLAMKQIEFYLGYYEIGACDGINYQALLQEFCFYIVPMTNPDGIMLAQGGISTAAGSSQYQSITNTYTLDREDRYTQQTQINEYLKIWKANANGVDLNRNFDALWEEYKGISRPSHKNYKGSSVASEPETQALVALVESIPNIQAVLCYHSQGEVLYWDCGQEGELREQTLDFTRIISEENGYRVIYQQNNDASFSDWCALKKGLIAVTVETGVESCPLPITQFPTIWTQNFQLLAKSAVYFSDARLP